MKKILIVDNDQEILNLFSVAFEGENYILLFSNSGKHALELLENQSVDLIITNIRMPIMDGYELLSSVKKLYPHILRMILSSNLNDILAVKTLQQYLAMMVFIKPFDNEVLINTIKRVFETTKLLENRKLLDFDDDIKSLPTIRSLYIKIMQMIENNCNISLVANEIESDTSISTKILRLANSALYARKTGSIQQAICFIGLQNTKNIVLATSVIDTLGTNSITAEYVENIWKQANICNKMLSFIYLKHLKKKMHDTYTVAGLLMNVGSVLMLNRFKEKYLELIQLADAANMNMTTIEWEAFETSHCEVGGYLLQWWQFPYPLVEVALYHHTPLDENVVNQELLCAAHIAVKYSKELLGKRDNSIFNEKAFEFLNISRESFEKSIENFEV